MRFRRQLGHAPLEADAHRLVTLLGTTASTGAPPAPNDAQYLVLAVSADLTSERVFTPGDGLAGTDSGAGATYDLVVDLAAAWSGLEFDSGDLRVDEDAAFTWTVKHTFTATPAIEIDVASGDPVIIFDTQGADKFAVGVDDSDLDKFKINSGGSLADPSSFEIDSSGNVEISGDFNLLTGKGVVHADGVDDGKVLRADGTRYVPGSVAIGDVTDLDGVQFVTMAAAAALSNERVLTAGDGIALTDGGAGNAATLAVDLVDVWSGLEFDGGELRVDEDAEFTWTAKHTFTATPAIEIDVASGDPVIIFDTQGADKFAVGVDDSDLDKFKINSGGSLADPSSFEIDSSGNVEIAGDFNLLTGKGVVHADGVDDGKVLRADGTRYVPGSVAIGDVTDLDGVQFVTMAAVAALSNERVLTAGDGIALTDGGAGSAATLAVDLVAAWSGLEFAGGDLCVDLGAAFTWTGLHTFEGGWVLGAGQTADLNGVADGLVIDADGDTSISADTDDQINVEVGGSDVVYINANGIGVKGVPDYPVSVSVGNVSTTGTFIIGDFTATKNAGVTAADDLMKGIRSVLILNQSGGIFGEASGGHFTLRLQDGSVGTVASSQLAEGGRLVFDQDGGTVNGGAYGGRIVADQEAGSTVTGGFFGAFISADADGTVGGTAYTLYLQDLSGMSYCIYQSGSAANRLGGDLDVAGNLTVTGTITDGGSDPPYLLFDAETRASVLARVREGVPTEKLGGAVLFFNMEAGRLEVWLPAVGEYRDLAGLVVYTDKPLRETFPGVERYGLNRVTGEIEGKVFADVARRYRVRRDCELDRETGLIYRVEVDDDHVRRRTGEVVPVEEAIVDVRGKG